MKTPSSSNMQLPIDNHPWKTFIFLLGLTTAVGLIFFLRIILGDPLVRTGDLALIIQGNDVPVLSFVVLEHRLPAATVGLLVGIALGISGTIFQTLLRNPLASPDVIGVSYGASTAAIIAITLFSAQETTIFGSALLGALLSTLLVLWVSRGRGGAFILVGIAISAALQGAISFLLSRSDIHVAQDALRWMIGSLNGSTWERAQILTLSIVVLIFLLAFFLSHLKILELGNETATSLGLNPSFSTLALILIAVCFNAFSVAVTGPISFVALLSGPIAQYLIKAIFHTGIPRAYTFITSGLIGALIVLLADLLGQSMFPEVRLPAGVITGIIDTPFLLTLLIKNPQLRRE
ncbi:FecCD family ABC transporter permease [Arcanobacterium ihumii]|uniref:FecCD family ABC transporter permease n=1 Tax=Arcanobacterium ihumii TaxID=2138162 RepID=UPI000F52C3B4|nr:iron ABC transporter permease [Arcanobacterium ihumii]